MRRPRLPRLPKSIVGLVEDLRRKEDRLSLVLSLFIGALVGLIVVAFILLTGRLAAHMYPAGGLGWRRILVPVLGSVVLASATAWMVLHLILGDNPLFHVPEYHLVSPGELGIYVLLGVISGLASVGFVKLLLYLRERFLRLPNSTLWFQPVIGGLVAGILGFFMPQVLGVGYDQVERVLNGDVILRTVLILAVLKIIATSVAYASGNAGGIFGPSLFIGAMVGASVGSVAHLVFPASTAGPGAYALVGMGAAFAGIIRTPLTSVIMIFELTRDYTIIVPLMISTLIAFFISQKLQREPIYEALAHQDGLHLPSGPFRTDTALWVTSAIRTPPEPFTLEMKVDEARKLAKGSDLESWPVVDDDGLLGMVRVSDVIDATTGSQRPVTIATILKRARPATHNSTIIPHLHSDQPLGLALARMGDTGHNVLPVVSRANART